MNSVNSPLKELYLTSEHAGITDWGTAQEFVLVNARCNPWYTVTTINDFWGSWIYNVAMTAT